MYTCCTSSTPMSHAHAENETKVQEALDLLIRNGNCTIVLVAHRLSTVANADLVVVVDQGRIVGAFGRH